jgi:hypothetical protein
VPSAAVLTGRPVRGWELAFWARAVCAELGRAVPAPNLGSRAVALYGQAASQPGWYSSF